MGYTQRIVYTHTYAHVHTHTHQTKYLTLNKPRKQVHTSICRHAPPYMHTQAPPPPHSTSCKTCLFICAHVGARDHHQHTLHAEQEGHQCNGLCTIMHNNCIVRRSDIPYTNAAGTCRPSQIIIFTTYSWRMCQHLKGSALAHMRFSACRVRMCSRVCTILQTCF